MVNDYFDHICHTEQRYGRSDNLTSFTTLGDTQIRWIFAQIYYPGQNCWKMSFGHFYYVKQKGGKLLLDRICYREQKRSKIHLRSLLLIWAKTWQMSVLLSNSPSSQNLSLSLKWPCQIMDGFLLDQFPIFSNLPFLRKSSTVNMPVLLSHCVNPCQIHRFRKICHFRKAHNYRHASFVILF